MKLAFALFVGRTLRVAGLCLAMTFFSVGSGGQAFAQEPPDNASVASRFAEWTRTLDRVGRDINALKLEATQIDALEDQAAAVRTQAMDFGGEIQAFADEARELLDAFVASGPADAAESAETQAQRKALEERVGLFDGWTRQVDLIVARADQVLDKISDKRLDQLTASLAVRGPIPLNPLSWGRAADELWEMASALTASAVNEARSWRQPGSVTGTVATMVIAVAVATWLFAFIVVRLAGRRTWPVLAPTLSGPVSRTLLAVLRSAAPWIAAIAAAWFAAPLKDWLPEAPGRAAVAALTGAGLTAAVWLWILRAVTTRPPVGMTSLVEHDGDRIALVRSLTVLIVLFSLDSAIHQLMSTFVSANLGSVWALIFTVGGTIAGRTAARVGGGVLLRHGASNGKLTRLALLVVPSGVATVSVSASALGYAQLGSYVFSNSLATAALFFLAWALRSLAHEIVVRACDGESPAGCLLQDRLGFDQPALRLVQFWTGILLDLAVVVGLALASMVVWGTGAEGAFLMMERLIEGVRVGSITLSLADLFVAIAIFVAGVWITRFAQRILEHRVFPGAQLDLGVKNSLRSGLGYIGVIVAGSIAIMALGINLSSLALVAGALSVGIGFGMQNIINNFVSGLILLIERPVKVGDWITVGGSEGLVTRINVRSTEIVTDNRASVLIPNGDFLSVSVTNWTHKDRGARLHITFQLPEALGAEGGRNLLLACAKAHPSVESDPSPQIFLQAIGGGYSFELAVDIPDVTKMKEVASDLRFAVDREIRKRMS